MSKDKFWNLIAKKLTEEATTKYPIEPELKIRFNLEQLSIARHILDYCGLGFPENQDPANVSYIHRKKIAKKESVLQTSDITSSEYKSIPGKGKPIQKFSTRKASNYRLILSENLSVGLNSGSTADLNEQDSKVSLNPIIMITHHNRMNMHPPDYLNSS
jgi:hypothetical protein